MICASWAHLEDLRQLAETGAFGEQQRGRALAGHMVQVELEPDGADLGDGWADVLQGKRKQIHTGLTHTHPPASSVCTVHPLT